MRVAVIKVAAIGDFLMATPALRALRGAPGVESLVLVAGHSIRDAVAAGPAADEVVWLDDHALFHGSVWQRAAVAWRVARRLRRLRVDVGLNFHRDWRYTLILWLGGAKRRIGFRAAQRGRLLTDALDVPFPTHHVFHYCALLRPLGLACADFRMEFRLAGEASAEARRRFLADRGLERFVALAPGGAANVKETMASRRWSPGRFAALARLLENDGWPLVVLGGEADRAAAGEVVRLCPRAVDLTGQTTLVEAAALLKQARLAVSNDSGLMHLASAMGTPVLALFGPTHPEEKRPLNEGSVAVWKGEKMECAPCYRDGRFPACEHVDCLARVSAEEVFGLARRMLAAKGP